MASATSKDSIQTNPECSTLPECCTEVHDSYHQLLQKWL